MSDDPTSLDRLHDIVMAPPVPWWPPAPGWLWLLVIGLILVLAALAWGLIRWQANRYRREALAELSALAEGPAQNLTELSVLLKRTALTAFPRHRVAAATGPDWFAFLDRTGGTRFSGGLGAALEQSNYHVDDAAWSEARYRELIDEIRAWIRHHDLSLAQVTVPEDASRQGRPA